MSADGAPRMAVGGRDGSPSSRAALRWAIRAGQVHRRHGRRRHRMADPDDAAELQLGPRSRPRNLATSPRTPGRGSSRRRRCEEVEPPDSRLVRSQVVRGHPAQVLLDAAADADLLVVGRRGHGSFAEALLGSVSQHCVHHAHCPVLIMRGEPDPTQVPPAVISRPGPGRRSWHAQNGVHRAHPHLPRRQLGPAPGMLGEGLDQVAGHSDPGTTRSSRTFGTAPP